MTCAPSFLRNCCMRFNPLYRSSTPGEARRVQKSIVSWESPNTNTLPVAPRSTNSSKPHTKAAISAQLTVGLAYPNHKACAATGTPPGLHSTTPLEPNLAFTPAPPSDCKIHPTALNSFSLTSTCDAGIYSTTSRCSMTGTSIPGSGACRSASSVSASMMAQGLSPWIRLTA